MRTILEIPLFGELPKIDPNVFIDAAENNEVDMIFRYSTYQNIGDVIEHKDEKGNTALLWAVLNKDWRMVAILLGVGANVNTANNEGDTPLILAAREGLIKITRILLTRHPDLDHINTQKKTAEQEAANKPAILNLFKLDRQAKDYALEEKKGETVNGLEQRLKQSGFNLDEIPDCFKCPVTLSIMVKPTTLPSGQTCEQDQAVIWGLHHGRNDPKTRMQIPDEFPYNTNVSLARAIEAFVVQVEQEVLAKKRVEQEVGDAEVKTTPNIWPEYLNKFEERLKKIGFNEKEIPDYFRCPITHRIMEDPTTVSSGFSYELWAISEKQREPIEGSGPIPSKLFTDINLVQAIELFVSQQEKIYEKRHAAQIKRDQCAGAVEHRLASEGRRIGMDMYHPPTTSGASSPQSITSAVPRRPDLPKPG